MGAPRCPNCKKGFLISRGKRYRRCNVCNYIKYKSPSGHPRGTILFEQKEKKEMEEEIPIITDPIAEKERRRSIPRGEGFHTEEYKNRKFIYDQQVKLTNKAEGIKKILKKLRKNKYNPIKQIMIEGELWDVETGQLVREKEKAERKEKEEFTPDRVIEEMVEGKS